MAERARATLNQSAIHLSPEAHHTCQNIFLLTKRFPRGIFEKKVYRLGGGCRTTQEAQHCTALGRRAKKWRKWHWKTGRKSEKNARRSTCYWHDPWHIHVKSTRLARRPRACTVNAIQSGENKQNDAKISKISAAFGRHQAEQNFSAGRAAKKGHFRDFPRKQEFSAQFRNFLWSASCSNHAHIFGEHNSGTASAIELKFSQRPAKSMLSNGVSLSFEFRKSIFDPKTSCPP